MDGLVEQLNIQTIIMFGLIIMGVWSFCTKIMEITKHITARHDREKKWDAMAESITKEREAIAKEREIIVERYDSRLSDLKTELEQKIDENYCNSEAKTQELKAEMYILTKSVSAVLDGLKQLNCNGQVTTAKKELDDFLMTRAYDQTE